jgi:hypothetical protein
VADRIIALVMTVEGRLLASWRRYVHLNLQNANLKNNVTIIFQIVVLHMAARSTAEGDVRYCWAVDLHLTVSTDNNINYSIPTLG